MVLPPGCCWKINLTGSLSDPRNSKSNRPLFSINKVPKARHCKGDGPEQRAQYDLEGIERPPGHLAVAVCDKRKACSPQANQLI